MKLKILGILVTLFVMTNTASATCTLQPISLESNITADWSSECNSTHRGDEFDVYYAKYYTFALTEPTIVEIDLTSDTIDTYLYLLEGADTQGTLLTYNDDGNEGTNSKIIIELVEGNYTIEATSYNAEEVGAFNLSLKESSAQVHKIDGTIELPQEILTRLEDCQETNSTCPFVTIHTTYFDTFSDDYIRDDSEVTYNEQTGNYEYSFYLLLAEEAILLELDFNVDFVWIDEENNVQSKYVSYSFGADQAIGGIGEDADTFITTDACDENTKYPLSLDLNTTLPTIPLDFSEYILTMYTTATMTITNIPSDTYINIVARAQDGCDEFIFGSGSNLFGTPRTYTFDNLREGVEYGLELVVEPHAYVEDCYYDEELEEERCTTSYDAIDYIGYRLNDDDGDFTNGGVFVEDAVRDENYDYVFDRTFLAMPEDMVLSEPNNLFEPKTAPVAPILYLLM